DALESIIQIVDKDDEEEPLMSTLWACNSVKKRDQEFVQLSKSLLGDPFLHKEIVMKAKEYVTKHHSWEHERKAYQNLVLMLQ
ncbi:Glycos_transf_1 domain-containing protein, partial [Podarcis lilfordi]